MLLVFPAHSVIKLVQFAVFCVLFLIVVILKSGLGLESELNFCLTWACLSVSWT